MCLDETWRERNQVLWGRDFLGGAALPVLYVAQGHGREGTMVTVTCNSGFTLECCLNCQLYPKQHRGMVRYDGLNTLTSGTDKMGSRRVLPLTPLEMLARCPTALTDFLICQMRELDSWGPSHSILWLWEAAIRLWDWVLGWPWQKYLLGPGAQSCRWLGPNSIHFQLLTQGLWLC